MIVTRTLQTDKIDLMQTLSSFVSKACRPGREERTTTRKQFLWTKRVKHICRLAIALTLLSPLTLVDLSHAAGRIIFDDFESYATGTLPQTLWTQDGLHP